MVGSLAREEPIASTATMIFLRKLLGKFACGSTPLANLLRTIFDKAYDVYLFSRNMPRLLVLAPLLMLDVSHSTPLFPILF